MILSSITDDTYSGSPGSGRQSRILRCGVLLLLTLFGTSGHPQSGIPGASSKERAAVWSFAREGGGGGTESYEVGAEDSLCQQLKDYKNRTSSRSRNYCYAPTRLFTGFSEPPWKELNPRRHKTLIAKLLRYRAEGPRRYFDRATVPERRKDAEDYYLRAAQTFVDGGGRIQLWLTAPYDPPGGAAGGEARSPRNLVQLRSPTVNPRQRATCKGPMDHAGLFFVTDDLQDPSSDVTDGFYSDQTIHLMNGTRVLLRDSPEDIEVLREEDGMFFRLACHLIAKPAAN